MSEPTIRPAFRFFLDHAGYSTPPGRAACALDLARAERTYNRAANLGVASFEWEYDDLPYEYGDVEPEEQQRARFESGEWTGPFWAAIRVGDEIVASLGGIVVGPKEDADPYARVVLAELADEALDDLRQGIGDALDMIAEIPA